MSELKNNHSKIYIIGIGEDGFLGLTEYAQSLLRNAEVVLGEPHCLDLVRDIPGQKLAVSGNLEDIVRFITENPDKRIVVLALGDPLFYGIARYLWHKLGKERFEVVPHVSLMQMAFARVKESWEDAFLANLSAVSFEDIFNQIRTAETVGLFTSEETPPNVVAQRLLEAGVDYFTAYVCENIGAPNERVTYGELKDVASQSYSPLNVLILVRKPDVPDRPLTLWGKRLFGNPDDAFLQAKPKRGLLTPAEIRAIALSELDVGPFSTVWDVGAGSGAVAIEAAQIASAGQVFAIEMDPDDVRLIEENSRRFGVRNLTAIVGRAPAAWADLPEPDCVFVGGSGRQVADLCELAFGRLKPRGRLVATMGSLENVVDIHQRLRKLTPVVNVLMVNLARGFYQFDRIRFQALNPTFLVSCVKIKENSA